MNLVAPDRRKPATMSRTASRVAGATTPSPIGRLNNPRSKPPPAQCTTMASPARSAARPIRAA